MPKIDASALIPGFCESRPVNPETCRAEDTTIEWLWRIGFLTTPRQEAHLRSFEFGLYHGIGTPDVEHDRLVLGLMWFCWGSLADDQYDNYDWGERGRAAGRRCPRDAGDCRRHVFVRRWVAQPGDRRFRRFLAPANRWTVRAW